jgi:hypothetical protein
MMQSMQTVPRVQMLDLWRSEIVLLDFSQDNDPQAVRVRLTHCGLWLRDQVDLP